MARRSGRTRTGFFDVDAKKAQARAEAETEEASQHHSDGQRAKQAVGFHFCAEADGIAELLKGKVGVRAANRVDQFVVVGFEPFDRLGYLDLDGGLIGRRAREEGPQVVTQIEQAVLFGLDLFHAQAGIERAADEEVIGVVREQRIDESLVEDGSIGAGLGGLGFDAEDDVFRPVA